MVNVTAMDEHTVQEDREKQLRLSLLKERNALSLMLLPVKMPVEWYGRLPRLCSLLSHSPEETQFHSVNQTVQAFLQMWKQRLMKIDGDHVWIHLTGFDCYDTIPRFARYVERKLRELDRQILEQHGLHALIQYWRSSVKDFQNLDDKAVLEARIDVLDSLHPLISDIAWVAFWAESFETAQDNICKIRPEVKTWIARHEKEYNFGEAFGGLLPYQL